MIQICQWFLFRSNKFIKLWSGWIISITTYFWRNQLDLERSVITRNVIILQFYSSYNWTEVYKFHTAKVTLVLHKNCLFGVYLRSFNNVKFWACAIKLLTIFHYLLYLIFISKTKIHLSFKNSISYKCGLTKIPLI